MKPYTSGYLARLRQSEALLLQALAEVRQAKQNEILRQCHAGKARVAPGGFIIMGDDDAQEAEPCAPER